MKILQIKEHSELEIIKEAVNVLQSGGIIIYPTETCYGIGVDATNQEAVDNLMKYKSRREGKPLSVAVTDQKMASKYVEINEIATNLYKNYLPGPITVVSKSLGNLAKGVESEYGTVGIRIPDYPLILGIVNAFGKPVTSTSANASYKPRPYKIETILKHISKKQQNLIDLILDAGELEENEPSTVVDTTLNNLNVMREGSLKFNEDLSQRSILLKANTLAATETTDFGSLTMLKNIDTMLDGPLVLALKGEMGAGKTQYVKGVAKFLHIEDDVSSPTYTIIDEYKYQLGKHREGYLIHMDTWRVDGAEEFLRTGLEGYMKKGNVIAIEWADKFYPEIKTLVESNRGKILLVEFNRLDENTREILVS